MIGVATNGLVRYIVADDEGHTSRAAAFLEGAISVDDPGFVSVVVLVELVWVLERTYRFSPDEIIGAIESVLRAEPLRIDRRVEVLEALGVF
jgi:predicted nucleic-acid-binding protein